MLHDVTYSWILLVYVSVGVSKSSHLHLKHPPYYSSNGGLKVIKCWQGTLVWTHVQATSVNIQSFSDMKMIWKRYKDYVLFRTESVNSLLAWWNSHDGSGVFTRQFWVFMWFICIHMLEWDWGYKAKSKCLCFAMSLWGANRLPLWTACRSQTSHPGFSD